MGENGRPTSEVRALCLDGGGYLGLATASFLAEAERHFNRTASQSFDLFCGTSTGGLIALALAVGKTASEVVDFYQRLGTSVFGRYNWFTRSMRFGRSLFFARYGNNGLR